MHQPKIKPLEDRIVILPDLEEKLTSSGLLLISKPKTDEPKIGTVMVAGPGIRKKPTVVKPGDKVMYQDYAVLFTHEEEGVKYDMVRETDILTRI